MVSIALAVSINQHFFSSDMQMLCQGFNRNSFLNLWRRGCRLGALFLLVGILGVMGNVLGLGLALAQGQEATPTENLLSQVTQWVRVNQRLTDKQFSMAPLDSRVQVLACQQKLVIDQPFANKETLRVRCLVEPGWQLYMKVQRAPGAPTLAAPETAQTPPVQTRTVVVARQALRRGTVLTQEMLEEVESISKGADIQSLSSIKDAQNSELVRDVPAATPLKTSDLRAALMVKQGQLVLLTVSQGKGFSISARVQAMQDGKMGDQVRLKNLESGRILTGIVTGPNAASGL
jgi:flagella basal body P-ring formation protein FlgA